ncbi:MAG: DUF58 domain-containing protein [Planctomycetes bacterium]|nr:DUF58 domain-containing protein [Planctomycetota bacterium]
MAKEHQHVYKLEEVLSSEARSAFRHLEIFARRMAEGLLHGVHKSKRKGISADFDHHKDYQPGDPLKHIDWKVSARQNRYYVKRYLEDTALAVRIVVDRSASMLMETDGVSKYLQACRVAACMANIALKQKDNAGLVIACAEETFWLPNRSSGVQLVRILEALASKPAASEDNLPQALKTLLDRGGYKGLMVIVTDLMYPPEDARREIGRLSAMGHEIILMHIMDRTEAEFPFNRFVEFHDLEVASKHHRLDAVTLKKIYHEEYQANINEWKVWAKKYNIHYVGFGTNDTIHSVLAEYIAYRGQVG